MGSFGRALLVLLAVGALAGWGALPRRLHAHAPEASSVAQAYTTTWNAHDLGAVLALFTPDAVVRERRGVVPLAVWDSRDPQVVRAYLDGAHDGIGYDPGAALVWVTGHQEIASWAAARFAQQSRGAAGPYRAVGDTVSWPYQEFSDPYQLMPGVGPLEGTAEAVVRGGRITRLTLVLSPESAARRLNEMIASVNQTRATQRTALSSPVGNGATSQPHGPWRHGPGMAERAPLAAPLALGGLALLGVLVATLRRRVPQP